MTKQQKHWADKHPVLSNRKRLVITAHNYATPQEFWGALENSGDMFWILDKTQADKSKITQCLCEFVEEAVFEREFLRVDRIKDAVLAARRYAAYRCEENRQWARVACDDLWKICFEHTSYEARAAHAIVTLAVFDWNRATAIAYAENLKTITPQADIIRRWFPEAPFGE